MSAVKDRQSIDRIIHDQAEALHGFEVTTIDGVAGKVAKGQDQVDDQHLVVHVDKGPLGLFGADVVVEVDAIDRIDAAAHEVHVDRITDWVRSSPKLDQFLDEHR